jgi:hypothetical protein
MEVCGRVAITTAPAPVYACSISGQMKNYSAKEREDMRSKRNTAAVNRPVKKVRFDIWFYNSNTTAKLPVSDNALKRIADRAKIVSPDIRNGDMYVSGITNPRLPCRFIHSWSIHDMNRFARVVTAIPEMDYPKLYGLLDGIGRTTLTRVLIMLAQYWPDAVNGNAI